MGKVKYILLALLVILVAGALGAGMAVMYQDLQATLQERQDKRDAVIKEKLAQEEAKEEAAKKKKVAREQRLSDKKYGKEHPDEVIRGLTADMDTVLEDNGSTVYRYNMDGGEGVFLSAQIVSAASPTLYAVLHYEGENGTPSNSVHILCDIGEYDVEFPLGSMQNGEGGDVTFLQPVDKSMEDVLRALAVSVNAKISLPEGSELDRNLTATEVMRIKNMVELYDILRGAKTTD
ncbi:MAG: hypothetical protein IJ849_04830 [Selenomonadaceae bacterium]|nr:hypothetical protein [Selenomonadaceae bacterium]